MPTAPGPSKVSHVTTHLLLFLLLFFLLSVCRISRMMYSNQQHLLPSPSLAPVPCPRPLPPLLSCLLARCLVACTLLACLLALLVCFLACMLACLLVCLRSQCPTPQTSTSPVPPSLTMVAYLQRDTSSRTTARSASSSTMATKVNTHSVTPPITPFDAPRYPLPPSHLTLPPSDP